MKPPNILNPFAFLIAGWRGRQLIRQLAWRKIETRYRGSVLGLFWTIVQPLLMLCIYTFVFAVVFKARWGTDAESNAEFALFLFSGIIAYQIFAGCVNEAPNLMTSNRLFVKQMIFPIEIFPWVSLVEACFDFLVGFLVLCGFYLLVQGIPPITAIGLPLVLIPILLGTLGISWFFASLGVYLRDLTQITGLLTTMLLFLSPIFYPVSRVPEALIPYYRLNPFATLLEMSKQALFYGTPPDWATLACFTLGAWLVAGLGFAWFMKTRKGFSDVL